METHENQYYNVTKNIFNNLHMYSFIKVNTKQNRNFIRNGPTSQLITACSLLRTLSAEARSCSCRISCPARNRDRFKSSTLRRIFSHALSFLERFVSFGKSKRTISVSFGE